MSAPFAGKLSLARRAWLAWRGGAGDELIQFAGLGALLIHATESGPISPIAYAVLACLLLHGRYSDREAALLARGGGQ